MSLEFLIRKVSFHEGRYTQFQKRYEEAAEAASKVPPTKSREFMDRLLEWIANPRNLRIAWEWLASNGGAAPGPNGHTWTDYSKRDAYTLIGALHELILAGNYHHGPLLPHKIPKRPGSRKTRTIWLANIEDRLVARATLQILEPWLDRKFHDHTFARRRRGPQRALAHALWHLEKEDRHVWITEDFRDAFDRVPQQRLLDILRSHVRNDAVCDLIERIIHNDKRMGIPQGSSLSPLLMTLFLHHTIGRPWRRKHAGIPLLFYVDDSAMLCREDENVETLYADFRRLAESAGMKPKHGLDKAKSDLRCKGADWLGYSIRTGQEEPEIRTPLAYGDGPALKEWRDALYQELILLHERPDAPLAVPSVINGIVEHARPALPYANTRRAYEGLVSVTRAAGFEEMPSYQCVCKRWQDAKQRWLHIRDCVFEEQQKQADLLTAPNLVAAEDLDTVPF